MPITVEEAGTEAARGTKEVAGRRKGSMKMNITPKIAGQNPAWIRTTEPSGNFVWSTDCMN